MTDILDIDSWTADTEPILVRLGGRLWYIYPPTFNDGARVAEQAETAYAKWERGEMTVEQYVDAMLQALLPVLRFRGVPDFLGRWAMRRLLRRRPIPYQLRAVQELTVRFSQSLRRSIAAVGGGTWSPNGGSGSISGSSSPDSVTTSPASSTMAASHGADSGGFSVR